MAVNINFRDAKSIYDFFAIDLNGNEIPMISFQGKVCVIINVSSKDSNVVAILKKLTVLNGLKARGVTILSFPCYQFGPKEEPKDLLQIIKETNTDIGQIFQPIEVNGGCAAELFKYLKLKQPGRRGGFITNSFTIFIVDKNGQPVERVSATLSTDDLKEIIEKYA